MMPSTNKAGRRGTNGKSFQPMTTITHRPSFSTAAATTIGRRNSIWLAEYTSSAPKQNASRPQCLASATPALRPTSRPVKVMVTHGKKNITMGNMVMTPLT
jgi:hypothetical protein